VGEILIVDAAVLPPGMCHVCGRSQGAMVDTGVDVPGDGRTYLCVELCLTLAANQAGFLSPGQGEGLRDRLREASRSILNLEAELRWERENKLMTVSDALKMQSVGAGATMGIGVIATPTVGVCSATKVDGTPCTATALPGRDVCVAHSKTKVPA
jgi:hypothetical protein